MLETSFQAINMYGKTIYSSVEVRTKTPKDRDIQKRLTQLNKFAEQSAIKEPDKSLSYADEIVRVGVDNYSWEQVAKAYNTMGTAYWYKGDYRNCIESHQQALEIWESLSDFKGIGTSLIGIGNAHLRKGGFHEALKYLQDALKVLKKAGHSEGIASIYNNIGVIYKDWGDYEKATLYYHKSLDIKEEIGSKKSIANTYNNIGILYIVQENYSKALKYLHKAESINRETDNRNFLADNYNNIALIHNREGYYQEALKYLSESLNIKKELGDKAGMTVSYREIGEVHKQQGNYETALVNYEKALAIREEINSRNGIGFFCNRIGETLLLMSRFDEAIVYLNKGLEINLETGTKEYIKEGYLYLSKVYAGKNMHEEAYFNLTQYINVKDELFNEERTKTINEIQTKYEAEKKDLQIEKLNLEQQYLIDINTELELFAGKAAHDLKEPLRMMSSYSGLLKMRYKEVLDEDGEDYLNIIQNASKRMTGLLNGLLEYARSGASNIKKENIDLNDILAHVKHNLQLKIGETNTQILSDELPTVSATPSGMLQLFQNIIANAIKFQQKDVIPVISIIYKKETEHHLISIQDNGIGIPIDQQDQVFEIFTRLNSRKHFSGSGIGLATCKKIIESLRGNIWLESTEGVGTTFHFTIPFTA